MMFRRPSISSPGGTTCSWTTAPAFATLFFALTSLELPWDLDSALYRVARLRGTFELIKGRRESALVLDPRQLVPRTSRKRMRRHHGCCPPHGAGLERASFPNEPDCAGANFRGSGGR